MRNSEACGLLRQRRKIKGTDMRSTRLKFIGCALAIVVILSLTSPPASQSQKPQNVEARINALLARMTLEEKLGQLQQLDGEANGNFRPEHLQLARQGLLGSTLNVRGAQRTNELQRTAVTESRLKIPLIFGFDVIHGYRTIFPIPLGEAASWDPAAVERAAGIAAAEARAAGVDHASGATLARGRIESRSGRPRNSRAIAAAQTNR